MTLPAWDAYWDERFFVPVGADSFRVYRAGDGEEAIVLLHGGGMTGLSFSLLAAHLKKEGLACYAIDYRGHGETTCADPLALSTHNLVNDVAQVCMSLFSPDRPIVLVGHSVGGAVAVRLAHSKLLPQVCGLVVIDVVEGTALAALPTMPMLLRRKPDSFPTLEDAIQWSLQSRIVQNRESAAISVPSQLILGEGVYRWRTDLMATEPYWTSWYTNLSQLFVTASASKMLIVAGTDRMDTTLTVAQMQGQFQFVLLPHAGHCVHEDDPKQVAAHLVHFCSRNQFAKASATE